MKADLLRLQQGPVDRQKEHFELRFGSVETGGCDMWMPVAIVGPPVAGIVTFSLLCEPNDENSDAIARVKKEMIFYLLEKGEPDPWGYAQYHCGRASNIYSQVHWSFTESAGPLATTRNHQKATDHGKIESSLKAGSTSKPPPPEAKNYARPGILSQIYPFIEGAIKEYSRHKPIYMTHDLLVKALLADPISFDILERRSLDDELKAGGWTPSHFAGNYIAFYGRDWTVGRPSRADGIERQKVKGKWAYRHSDPSMGKSREG